MRPTLSHALRTAAPETADGQLLDRFARHRDEEAFAAVVRRHGPMVLGVCRRLLGNRADADDAFQATFLVLARRAATLGRVEALAGWLHGVAVNAARKLRHMNARRIARERRAAGPSPLPADDLVRDELLAALDAEIARLPAAYRDAVVLCDLEGATRKDAARRLGCPEGTVAGRLARARALLAKRLTDRGLVFAGLAGLTAAVPPKLLATAIEAATAGPSSARVAAATEGVMKAMLLTKIRAATAVLVVGALAMTGIGVSRGPADEKPAPVAAPVPVKGPTDRRVTAFPLKKLKVGEVVRVLTDVLAGKGKGEFARWANELQRTESAAVTAGAATLVPIEAENTLLVYADEPTTGQVEAMLRKLGEPPPKVATRIAVTNVPAAEAAKVLAEVFGPGRATFAPIPGEDAVIVYATETDTQTVRQLFDRAIDAPPRHPAAQPALAPPPLVPVPVPGSARHAVAFQDQSWEKVFQWYANVSGRPCLLSVKPTGTFTYQSPPGVMHSVAEITDVLNDALLAKGFVLVRRGQSDFVYQLDAAARDVKKGLTAATTQTIRLKHTSATEVAEVLQKQFKTPKLVGITFDAANNTLVIEADPATLAEMADVVKKLDAVPSTFTVLPLKNVAARDVVQTIQKMFAEPDRVRMTADAAANSVIVLQASPADLERIKAWVRKLDEPPPPPEPKVLRLKNASAQVVAEALNKVYGQKGQVRVAFDAANNSLVIQGAPAEVRTVVLLAGAFDDAFASPEAPADVEQLRDRVKFAELMVKRGFMPQSQLQAERDKLAAAEAKLEKK